VTTSNWPGWLTDYLDGEGIIDVATRLTHQVRRTTCPSCHSMVLAALDDDLSLPVHVDAMPTTAVGELTALLYGLRTYTLITGNLCHRDSHRIDYRCADFEPVHAEHSCSAPWLPVNEKFAPMPTYPAIHVEPPF
jgi:hypothetical protein